MTLSMYQASSPFCVRQLNSFSAVLAKGAAFATEQGIDPATLLEARLAPDMFPLTRQVQIASDLAKGGIARLAGRDIPSWPDEETSFDQLRDRLARTIAFIEAVPAAEIDGSEEREIVLKLPSDELRFNGRDYLFNFVLTNLFFHYTTAYDILRHKGVPLGKRDFLGII